MYFIHRCSVECIMYIRTVCMCVCVCVYFIYIYVKDFVSIGIKCMRACSVVSDSFVTPWTVAHQAPLSMGFSRQEYWSGWPCPPPGDCPKPGIQPTAPATSPALAGGFFITEPPRKPVVMIKGLPQILVISSCGPQKLDHDRLIM